MRHAQLRKPIAAADTAHRRAIVDGRQLKGMQLEELTGMPSAWDEQQHRLTFERFAKIKPRPLNHDRDMGRIR
jgi:hypothetical protein